MSDIDAVCFCGKDMAIESQGDFVRLACECGNHKLVNVRVLKPASEKDTQPVPVITEGMSMDDIHAARERLTSETRDGATGEKVLP